MPTEEVQLAWKLSISGADEVKASLAQLHEQFNKGEISLDEYTKGLRNASSNARTLAGESQMNTRIWLAQHPAINQLSRTMSGFNRVLSATVQAMTLMNTATLVMRSSNGEMIDLQNQLAEAERNYNKELDPEKKESYARQIASIKDNMSRLNEQMSQDKIQGYFSLATGIGSIAASALIAAPSLASLAGSAAGSAAVMIPAFGGISIAAGPLILIIAAIAAVVLLLIMYWPQLTEAFKGFIEWAQKGIDWLGSVFAPMFEGIWKEAGQFVDAFVNGAIATWNGLVSFFEGVWKGLSQGFTFLWDGLSKGAADLWDKLTKGFGVFWEGLKSVTKGAIDAIVGFISGMVNSIIGSVRSALEWIAKLPSNISSTITTTINSITGGGSTVKKGAVGLNEVVNEPTLFMAGEAGRPEQVKITPLGRAGGSEGGGSGGGTTVINNYIEGSIHSERDLEQVMNRYGIRQARRRGWKV
jgi:uncharacterized membrane protein